MPRVNGIDHPLHNVLAKTLVSFMHGTKAIEFESLRQKWFGGDEAVDLDNNTLTKMMKQTNTMLGLGALGVACVWSILLCINYRSHIRRAMMKKKMRRLLGLSDDHTIVELRAAARQMYFKYDTDRSIGFARVQTFFAM